MDVLPGNSSDGRATLCLRGHDQVMMIVMMLELKILSVAYKPRVL